MWGGTLERLNAHLNEKSLNKTIPNTWGKTRVKLWVPNQLPVGIVLLLPPIM